MPIDSGDWKLTMRDIPTLETNRLVLRALSESDFPTYRDFYGDGEASAFYGGPKSETEACNKLSGDLEHWRLRGHGLWALETKQDGKVVGVCGLVWTSGWPRSELTWWITSDSRRQGFAKEASKRVIRFGYETLKWDLVQTHMKDENIAARSLVLSLGGTVFARETFPDGVTRDIYKLPR